MKKILLKSVFSALFASLTLCTFSFSAGAAGEVPGGCAINPFSSQCILQKVGSGTDLPDFYKNYKHPDAPDDFEYEGVETATSPVLYIIDVMRFALSGVAFLVIVVAAIKLMASDSAEEELKNTKNTLIYGIIGLIIVQLASTIVRKMVFGDFGEAFVTTEDGESVTGIFASNTASEIRGVIGFINILLGAVAMLVIIVRGFTLVVTGADEEAMGKAKKHIGYAFVGLVIVGLSEMITRGVLFPAEGQVLPNVETGRQLVYTVVNFLSGFVAIASFVMLFYAGYLYVVAGAQDESLEKVKKIIVGAVIGLVVSMGAYAVVNTLLNLSDPDANQASGTRDIEVDIKN